MPNPLIRLEDLRNYYKGQSREAFEDMALHFFMRKLNLVVAPVRRKNQEGIESDPVDVLSQIDGDCAKRRYAFQAKFFDEKTEIKDRKDNSLTVFSLRKSKV